MKAFEIEISVINNILGILGGLIAVSVPIVHYFKKSGNGVLKKKKKIGTLIDMYLVFLIAPLISMIIQFGAMNE